MLNQEPMEALL